ncbi:unnamed protein product [Fusarium graminearum]|uniref:Chromosome 3, complete genome n=2 Tax=Gibberella zeae TaxID=5518 RepID=A0A098E0C1_GIBZE|nr:unnamed protein product [Fusarium graminearum]CAF3630750.1 unnamed protein product [Fusarium graminearum]CAG1984003.1 unnamed protein product [Fusarium graminearum]CAG1985200.1 unnamed protein product [Fusarium graminearum]CEF87551.1 unnamed protein product [Fusarium graminearum]
MQETRPRCWLQIVGVNKTAQRDCLNTVVFDNALDIVSRAASSITVGMTGTATAGQNKPYIRLSAFCHSSNNNEISTLPEPKKRHLSKINYL